MFHGQQYAQPLPDSGVRTATLLYTGLMEDDQA
jgi:hypothetical protein